MLQVFDLPETAFAHLRFWLNEGAAGGLLSEYFSQQAIERGAVRTALPDTVDPSEVEQYQTDLSWQKWSREQHREVWWEACERILSYLARRTDGIAIADFWQTPEKLLSDPPVSNYFTCRSQYPDFRSVGSCLYVAEEGANAEKVDTFLRERGDAVVLLTSIGELSEQLRRQPASDGLLMEAARNSIHILSRVYDHCAFMYWTRAGHSPL
jgi:hypothetical protein